MGWVKSWVSTPQKTRQEPVTSQTTEQRRESPPPAPVAPKAVLQNDTEERFTFDEWVERCKSLQTPTKQPHQVVFDMDWRTTTQHFSTPSRAARPARVGVQSIESPQAPRRYNGTPRPNFTPRLQPYAAVPPMRLPDRDREVYSLRFETPQPKYQAPPLSPFPSARKLVSENPARTPLSRAAPGSKRSRYEAETEEFEERPVKRRRETLENNSTLPKEAPRTTSTARKIMASLFPRTPLEELQSSRAAATKRKPEDLEEIFAPEEDRQSKKRRVTEKQAGDGEDLPTFDISGRVPSKVDQLLKRSQQTESPLFRASRFKYCPPPAKTKATRVEKEAESDDKEDTQPKRGKKPEKDAVEILSDDDESDSSSKKTVSTKANGGFAMPQEPRSAYGTTSKASSGFKISSKLDESASSQDKPAKGFSLSSSEGDKPAKGFSLSSSEATPATSFSFKASTPASTSFDSAFSLTKKSEEATKTNDASESTPAFTGFSGLTTPASTGFSLSPAFETSATTSTGFSLSPVSKTSTTASTGFSLSPASETSTTASTAFSFGASSTASTGFSLSTTSTPASTGFSLSTTSTPASTSLSFGASTTASTGFSLSPASETSTPASTGFSFGASSSASTGDYSFHWLLIVSSF
eukprot:TRINITY_DN446_c0_g2_i6.p1 TRINITY_DN446_c0_g2~~TRINITY_DN446_c0_g2_i6.p1  ORF type:complete len:664 (-),score=147.10 TRINITY_DN446_c0_g2_i6:1333-3249(-)